MASCSTTRWVSTSPYVTLTVTVTSNTESHAKLKYELRYISDYAANTTNDKEYAIVIDGTTVASGKYDISGKYETLGGPYIVRSGTVDIPKGTASKTIHFSVSFGFNVYWSDVYSGTRSASGSLSIGPKTSYKVTYNANGGSGAPSSQTKWYGTALTLSKTKPTRTGHSFEGWATSASGSVAYDPGDSYTGNATITLYAVWKANTYKVTFNANGGTGAPAAQTKTYGKTLTLSNVKPTRTNYNFLGWGTSASATTVVYTPGASYTSNAQITLYAVWSLAYAKPRIGSFTIARCDSSGDADDYGTYALVKFSWTCDRTISSVVVEIISSSGEVTAINVPSSGTSGSVNQVIGNGLLSAEASYTIRVVVTDSNGYKSASRTLAGIVFPIDMLPENKGVAFGKPAESAGFADFGYNALFPNMKGIYGVDLQGNVKMVLQPQNENGNITLGWDNYDTANGYTNIYGHDVHIGVSNMSERDTFRPYRRQGDSVTFSIRTAGYVTNDGKDVSFLIPFAVPIIGSPTVTVTSGNGFTLRQGSKYTHGSSASTYTTPDSYTAVVAWCCGVYVTAKFSDTTNVTNNDSIGIYWNGTVTFT
jgi:uncharacterized repeat protein (TIGR02543 family)